jgi:small subunit ribosomal protein S4e
MSKHLKRFSAPSHWGLETKVATFATKPSPGPHSSTLGIPLLGIIRDFLGYARNSHEAKKILEQGDIKVDHVIRKNHKYAAGLMDVITIEKTGENFRLLPSSKGLRIQPIPDSEAKNKLVKVTGKSTLKGGNFQLNLHDGSNMEVEAKEGKKFSVGDVLQITIPDKTVKDHLKIEEGNVAFVYKGKNSGLLGTIGKLEVGEGNQPNLVDLTVDGSQFQTLEDYIFVVGRKRSKIKVD